MSYAKIKWFKPRAMEETISLNRFSGFADII